MPKDHKYMFNQKKIKKLEEEIKELKKMLKSEQEENGNLSLTLNVERISTENYKKRYENLFNEKYDRIEKLGFSINFKILKAFSIERHIQEDGREATIIGHKFNNDGTIKEWVLYCSRDTHEQLVTQFNEQPS